MEERRSINRVEYKAQSIIVTCDTYEQYFVNVDNVSPLGMGITAPSTTPNLLGRDVIIVAETLIMYADITRQEMNPDGTFQIGIQAKKFTKGVLEYLFQSIGTPAQ